MLLLHSWCLVCLVLGSANSFLARLGAGTPLSRREDDDKSVCQVEGHPADVTLDRCPRGDEWTQHKKKSTCQGVCRRSYLYTYTHTHTYTCTYNVLVYNGLFLTYRKHTTHCPWKVRADFCPQIFESIPTRGLCIPHAMPWVFPGPPTRVLNTYTPSWLTLVLTVHTSYPLLHTNHLKT